MSVGLILILEGHVDGTFNTVCPQESGIIISNDAKSVAKADLNGDSLPDILISSNDGPITSYTTNASVNNTNKIRVILRGQNKNIHAIGAKVTANYSDSSKHLKEVKAGAGYLSQSTPHLFFGANGKIIQSFKVRWPDGKVTDHKLDSENRVVTQSKSI